MSSLALDIRLARQDDAADVAQVYISSWHDTYPGLLPEALLRAMTPKGQTTRWLAAIRAQAHEKILVADSRYGIVGMTGFGPARDRALGYDGEIYTLYVEPGYFGLGIGRALMKQAFETFRADGVKRCMLWAHARNNARFFYEAMGGRLIAERETHLMGEACPEVGFGWNALKLSDHSSSADPASGETDSIK